MLMKKRNWLLILLLISIGINLLLSYTNIRTLQSNSKEPTGTYMFSLDSNGDEEYEQYYLLLYPNVNKEYEIRLYTASSNPNTGGTLSKNIEEGFYNLEYNNCIIHTESLEGKEHFFFLTTDDIYFIKNDNLVICEKLADYVYRV